MLNPFSPDMLGFLSLAVLVATIQLLPFPARSLSSENDYNPKQIITTENDYNPKQIITTENAVNALRYWLLKKYPETHEMHNHFKDMYTEGGYFIAYNEFLEDAAKCEAGLDIDMVIASREIFLRRKAYFIGREPIIKAMCENKSLNQVEKEFK